MKDLEKLKKEQEELKERLLKLVAFINSEEYYQLELSERNLLNQQRAGMEVYLNALTRRIWGESNLLDGSSALLPIMMSMLMPSFSFSSLPSDGKDKLQEVIDAKES